MLKSVYGIKIQAYHGGSLTGKDIQKVMMNAGEIFHVFAGIMKKMRKIDCSMSDEEIDALCCRYSNLFLLWDGAFSYASTTNPTPKDVEWYTMFSTTAVKSHVDIGCNVTPKVHMMLKHVAKQMSDIPGGLGEKREDWVEHLHQVTSVKRKQFRTTIDKEVRARAMENAMQLETDPKTIAYMQETKMASARGPRKAHIKLEETRREKRMRMRMNALVKSEPTCVVKSDGKNEGEENKKIKNI